MKKTLYLSLFFTFIAFSCDKKEGSALKNQEINTLKPIEANSSKKEKSIIVDVKSKDAISDFLIGKMFTSDNMGLKFQPGDILEYYGNGHIMMNGEWQVGSPYGSTQRMILINDNTGGTGILYLGSDGKIMDKATLKIFK